MHVLVRPWHDRSPDVTAAWLELRRRNPALANPLFHPTFAEIVARHCDNVELAQISKTGIGIDALMVFQRIENPERYREYLDKLLSFFSFAGWGLILAILLLGDWGVTTLFGRGFAGSGSVLLLLSASTLINFSGAVRDQVIFIANRPNLDALNALIGLVVVVLADLLLIPRWGALGGAAAMTIGSFTVSMLTSLMFTETSFVGRLQFRRLFFPSLSFWRVWA